jgi:hypothetical protein
MHSFRVRHDRAIGFVTVFGLLLLSSLGLLLKLGTAQEVKIKTPEYVQFRCADQTVKVDPKDGTNPKAVYLCPGNTLTWDANHHTFVVAFQKKSPFTDGQMVFDNDHYQSAPAVNDTVLTVYSYAMIVDRKPVDDPQVVGGGGH